MGFETNNCETNRNVNQRQKLTMNITILFLQKVVTPAPLIPMGEGE